MTEFKSVEQMENNFSIYLNNEGCKLGVGHNWLTFNRGTDVGDREPYSCKDEKGINYRIYYYKKKREFGELHVDDPTYQGVGNKKFTIPKSRQFIHIG
ncbi:MAG: hypothetical protein I3270_00395 [Candidatus Moeniiplasma glomeromycotorum]|nr:hypothetical protein [Candidatus Moeniiplasma glomeromycotorum]MCE8162245.1 hypothetical protein [Candidatus Moeniiplasma glomeromycotorum]MCE8166099.1 hypothetical protein [Candidatus Moeniiplasma glomeromycotorum]MCE8166644.1 hypothetical protein [Candidatus Moeniiplasma glomeromycotorum]